METGIYQSANPYVGGSSATASIDNGGDLKVEGFAKAKAGGTAIATVTLDYGISQYAKNAEDATVTLTNDVDGSLTIAAIASATAGRTMPRPRPRSATREFTKMPLLRAGRLQCHGRPHQ